MALTFAVAAAILLGTSDFFAARAARIAPSMTVTRSAVGVSTVLSPLLLLFVDSEWIARDLVLGALAGLAMTGGLAMLYHGYSVARMGVVAPMSSVLLAAVPVVSDIVGGDRPGPLAAVGIVLGLLALVLTSYAPGSAGSVRTGAVLGTVSGVAFGIAFTLMGEVSDEAGLAPVITQRLAGASMLIVIGLFGSAPMFVSSRDQRTPVLATGAVAICAIASLQIAFQNGSSGPVSVAASQFATVAVVLSVIFYRERMRWWQGVGVGASAVGVALMAAGG
jgi:drug/metabolite transporter (DMT)-like permease